MADGGRCGASAMVCHNDVYQGSLLAGFAASLPGCAAVAAPGASWT